MESIFNVIITAALGTWLAYVWQQRSAKQTRYFEASKAQHELMHTAVKNIADLIGRRLYATQRLCRISPSNAYFEEAKNDFRQSVLDWNRKHLQMDLDIRTLFAGSPLTSFESLQSRLASITNEVSRRIDSVQPGDSPAYSIVRSIETLRGDFFLFLQEMIRESDFLFRQMHFGVVLKYNASDIERYSTPDLLKVLLRGSEKESAVLRSPSDFGLPVESSDARLGINEQ